MRSAAWYRAMKYRPGGRDWMFRGPAKLEFALTMVPSKRIRSWIYLHWPIEPRRGQLG